MSKINIQPQKEQDKIETNVLLRKDDLNIQHVQYGGASTTDKVPSETKEKSFCMKFYGILITLTIEPIVFSYMYAFLMSMAVLPNLIMDKACLYYFNYSTEVCKNISSYDKEKENVEIVATNYTLYSNLVNLLGAFLMIFIAPWSDKYGRKPPLLLSIFGSIVTDIGLLMCILRFDSNLGYIVLAKVPVECFGGFICVLTIVYSSASEVSSMENRTLKYTAVEIAMGLGMGLGSLTGGFLYKYCGYFYVYLTVLCLHTFALIWGFFIVEETRGIGLNATWSNKLKDFFAFQSFKNTIKASFKRRQGYGRCFILMLILSMCIIVLTYEARGNIGYVFVHHNYDWDPTKYSILTTTIMMLQLVFTLTSVPILTRIFKVKDFTLGFIGASSMMAKNMYIAFSMNYRYIYYIGQISGIMGQLSTLAIRTGISKIVDKEELGRVFSFLATCEAIMPMLGSIAITKLFEATMDINPNLTYLGSAFLLLLPLGTFTWGMARKTTSYNLLNAPTEDNFRGES